MFQIVWTPLAFDSYQKILDYILDNWSIQVVVELDEKVKALEQKLSTHLFLCPASESHPELRKCVVTKQTSMIYRVNGNLIEVVAFIDNRMDYVF